MSVTHLGIAVAAAPFVRPIVAHELTAQSAASLPVSPVTLAAVAGAVLLVAAGVATPRAADPETVRSPDGGTGRPAASAPVALPAASAPAALSQAVFVQGIALAALIGIVVVTRTGWSPPGPGAAALLPLVVLDALGPSLIVVTAIAGPAVWAWMDPWDALGRLVSREEDAAGRRGGDDVRWAAPVAVLLMWFVAAHPLARDARTFGSALAVYTLLMAFGCLVVGRRRWLSSAHVVGLLLAWTGRIRNGGLLTWSPPRGSAAVLGVVIGGALFGELRTSDWWDVRDLAPQGRAAGVLGLLLCCGTGALTLAWAERGSRRRRAAGTTAAAAVPVALGLFVGLSLTDNRLPRGLDGIAQLLGAPAGTVPELGGLAVLLLQLAAFLAGGVVGATVAARRNPAGGPLQAAVLASAAVVAVASGLVTAA